jgi:predicted exporter
MIRIGRLAIALWALFLAITLVIVSRAEFVADLSFFLPGTPTQEQRLMVEQLSSGVASRLILVGIDGGEPAMRAQVSRAMAAQLRGDSQFLHVANGEVQGLEADRRILLEHRYLLSPAVDSARFSEAGLNAALQDSIEQLSASTGLFGKSLLTRDPTGEFTTLLENMVAGHQPLLAEGVWAGRDGSRALLLARTRADGADTDGQAQAVAAIQAAFQAALAAAENPSLQLALTGPGPFSVNARTNIKEQVTRLSGLGMLIIVVMLGLVYRSLPALLLGLLPVLSGALAGIAAVSLGFGSIHGITIGFGTALIGEAVDYSIYLMTQRERGTGAAGQARWLARYWPTIRIGVMTSLCGFGSLLFSGFPGLAQLGLYAMAGLITAALTTRYVLPHLLPADLQLRDLDPIGRRLASSLAHARRLRPLVFLLFAAACAVLLVQRDSLWNKELAALSPISAADQALDMAMRADLGAPDVSYLVVVTAAEREPALAGSERVGAALRQLVDAGVIAGFESPANYLPSQASQRQRQASLPPAAELRQRFNAAIVGLPLQADRFGAFFDDVEQARQSQPLTRQDLEGSSLALAVDALLVQTDLHWTALLPLRAVADSQQRIDPAPIRKALAETGLPGVYFVDLKVESDRLYTGYLQEAIMMSLAGLVAILGLLYFVTRSLQRVLRIATPLVMAVAVVIAGLVIAGQQLTILHLVGMLLVVAVGSNYALFFDQGDSSAEELPPRTLASLLLAVATTVAGFGVLGFSSVPVLNAIGVTVAPGAVLALLFSAILARRS